MSTIAATNLKNPSSGSNNIVLNTDGTTTVPTLSSTTITGTTIQGTIKSGTAVASTSGTAIDFTGLPSWVTRVTVMFSEVSRNAASALMVRLGTSSGFVTSGYLGNVANIQAASTSSLSSGFSMQPGGDTSTSDVIHGAIVVSKITGNTWVAQGGVALSNTSDTNVVAGTIALAAALTQIRVTTSGGTATFTAGTVNILYEG
jgi:hypothetical protein